MKGKDKFEDIFTANEEIELQRLEAELGAMFTDITPAPTREGFESELRSKVIEGQEPQLVGEEGKKRSFFLSSTLAGIKSFFSFNGKSGQRKLKFVAAFALVIFMFTALFYGIERSGLFVKPAFAGEIKIAALKEDVSGIETDTTFLLTSENTLDKKTVEENLQVSPSFDYRLEKEAGGKQYKIIPQTPLNNNTVYQLSFDSSGQGRESFSWAFQTKGQFRVLSSLPGRNSSRVPVNTGIELVFSHENFSTEKAAQYFSISPEVKGKFEKHKKTLVFVPEELKYGQIYTVTMKKGFPLAEGSQSLSEDYKFAFETLVEEQNDETKFSFDIYDKQAEFSTANTPFYPLNFYWEGQVPKAQVEVYRYTDVNSFVAAQAKLNEIPSWAFFTRNAYREDFNQLSKFDQFEVEIIERDKYSHYLVFPKELPAGLYAARIKMAEAVQQVWFQVSDMAVYLTQSRENGLLWANSLTTGQPVNGAKVTVVGQSKSWTTDPNGTVFIKERLAPGSFAIVQKDSQTTVVDLSTLFGSEEDFAEEYNLTRDYWKYLYLDRGLYKPGDTVHYWGIFSPRKGAPKLSEVTLELHGYSGPYYAEMGNSALLEQQVKVEDQTFTGEMQLPVLRPGYYYIQVKSGDTVLTSYGFNVETYIKPAYQLTIENEKKAVFAGEKTSFKVQAAFFEGTPVPNLRLNYYLNGEEGSVTTDEKGRADIPYQGKYQNGYSNPRHVYLSVNASLPEAGQIHAENFIYVFDSRVNIESEAERKDTSFTLHLDTQQVDLSRLNQGEFLSRENYLMGPAPNTRVNGKIVKEVWTKEEIGEYYDFINKKVEKTYDYRYSTEEMGEFEVLTGSDGKATYQGQLDDAEASYFIELSALDNLGVSSKNRIYIYSRTYNSNPGYYYYHLEDQQRDTGYKVGETVQLTFKQNEQELNPKKQSFLFYQAQKELISYSIRDDAKYSFPFTEGMNPNTTVAGVYFDGQSYQETTPIAVGVAPESKKLHVTITSDKEEYRPGDKVKLVVQVTDSENKPTQAEVNLNLVDEALFSLANQQVDLLGRLYRDYIFPHLFTRRTHYNPHFGGGAEHGGEGGGERTDFRDTVLFATLQTGRDGKATSEFTLPDNLTSWRVTYHALTADLAASSGAQQIPVRLPFFVDVTMNAGYHVGDKPVLILRSYGNKLAEGQKVTYQTLLKTPSGQEIKGSGQGISFTPYDWQLPALEEGVYTLTVTGKSGSHEDTVSLQLPVEKAMLERTVTNFALLDSQTTLRGSTDYPTKVIFSDYEKSQYLTGLYNLAWTFGSRIEQQLAAREARKLLQQYFPEDDLNYSRRQEEVSFVQYQQANGGISILPYSESELTLSALVASYNPEDFDSRALAGYFYNILEGEELKEDDKTLALWGLAALKEPVLLQIKTELKRQDLQPAEKIQLAMALLELGDGAYGQTVFQDILKHYGEDLGDTMRITGPQDQDDIVAATTQMALLAARLDAPEKGKLYQYILENPGKEMLNTLEQLQILKYSLQYMQSKPVSFTYQLNGKSEKVSLQGKEVLQLNLLPEELAKIRFSGINGKVGVSTVYFAPLMPGDISKGEGLSLTRSYSVNNKTVQELKRGDLVKVILQYTIGGKAPNGSYEIVDLLPAGLAYVQCPYRPEERDPNITYPSEVYGQQLTFTTWQGNGKLVYYARVLTPGEYECGAPYLGNIENQGIYLTGATNRVVIK